MAASEPDRQIVFLGDFIDRGPENGAVVRIVRELMDSGRAQAIMGNHELNAIHFHATDPDTGKPLRKHSEENFKQHDSFLKEFPLGAPHTKRCAGLDEGCRCSSKLMGFVQSMRRGSSLQSMT